MAVISFWGNSEKETGQTVATLATATSMAIDHNYKTLAIGTGFKERAYDESFWVQNEQDLHKALGVDTNKSSVESGVEGLARIIRSNVAKNGVVGNYVKVVFRDRLDILPAPKTEEYEDYVDIAENYPNIVSFANQSYNMVFVDVDKRLPSEIQKSILLKSDIIAVNMNQGQRSLNKLIEMKAENDLLKKNNMIVIVGKYDRFSKYNLKNIGRELKERYVCAIPYNTLFYESTTEGKVADYFLRFRDISDTTDRNAIFINETKKTCDMIITKLQELKTLR